MDNILIKEMDVYGYTYLNKKLTSEQIAFFSEDLIKQKEKQILIHGEEKLNKYNELEFLRNVGSFHENYLNLIESNWLNDTINSLLNEKAILHGYHGILTNSKSHKNAESEKFSPMRFHRDQPWFKDTRTCILILMPLVDFTEDNGPTEYVPSTHLFQDIPKQEFLEKHMKKLLAPAGTIFIMDGSLCHRAGINTSGELRPMLQMNVTLAFMKQQIDVWASGKFDHCSDIVKQRLGYNVRNYKEPEEMFNDNRKWTSGNYTMDNTRIK